MDKQFFIELLKKYKEEKSSVKENRLLVSYYNLFDAEAGKETILEEEEKNK